MNRITLRRRVRDMTDEQLQVALASYTDDYHDDNDEEAAVLAGIIDDEIDRRQEQEPMKIKLFYLHPANPDLDLWEDCEAAACIVRAPSAEIAREQPKRDDSWFTNGGKSPWLDPELVKCFEIGETDLPPSPNVGQDMTPEQATGILYAVPK